MHQRYHLAQLSIKSLLNSSDSKRTDGSRLDHVPYGESLDGLVLGRASRTIGATDRLNMATTLLVASAVIGFVSETCTE